MITGNSKIKTKDIIIAFLCSARSTRMLYRVLYQRMHKQYSVSISGFSQSVKLLETKGLIRRKDGELYLVGERYNDLYRYALLDEKIGVSHKLLLMFDIPETHRRSRDWLRNQVISWKFSMVQKSV